MVIPQCLALACEVGLECQTEKDLLPWKRSKKDVRPCARLCLSASNNADDVVVPPGRGYTIEHHEQAPSKRSTNRHGTRNNNVHGASVRSLRVHAYNQSSAIALYESMGLGVIPAGMASSSQLSSSFHYILYRGQLCACTMGPIAIVAPTDNSRT